MRGHHLFAAMLALALAGRGVAGTMADPICTDRPGKGSAPCTTPKGHWQVETSLAQWSLTNTRDSRERSLTIGDTAIKYGLTHRLHVELAAPLLVSNWTRTAGVSSRASGFGDVKAKLKQELTPTGAAFTAALYPFV
jgi:hypothetical protein